MPYEFQLLVDCVPPPDDEFTETCLPEAVETEIQQAFLIGLEYLEYGCAKGSRFLSR